MIIKALVIVAFILILISLGSALYHLIKHKAEENSAKTAKALTVRIGLSLLLFLFVAIALFSGLIKPHGIGARIQQFEQQHEQTKPQSK